MQSEREALISTIRARVLHQGPAVNSDNGDLVRLGLTKRVNRSGFDINGTEAAFVVDDKVMVVAQNPAAGNANVRIPGRYGVDRVVGSWSEWLLADGGTFTAYQYDAATGQPMKYTVEIMDFDVVLKSMSAQERELYELYHDRNLD